MDAERLKQIEEIYHAALEIKPDEREGFFNEFCCEDIELRREVESLLSFKKTSGNFLDTPPASLAAEMFSEKENPKIIGRQINQYKILSLLGKGGMGEVYLAEDMKLDRKVALKFLPREFALDKDRMSRFVREAKSASTLNHPNIITIYEINKFEGTNFIAAEFIDGKTLNEFVKNDPLEVKPALNIAIQIASALDEAHSTGIIHRDIKPDNVMVRSNGLVKVLDFGIAKLIEMRNADFGRRNKEAETLTQSSQDNPHFALPNSQSTSPGMIIGTANYMSPEQAKGGQLDKRTDIFSFGVVLYEMLAGHLPFEGETAVEMIGAILRDEPKPLDQNEVPPEIKKIVGKCLKKDRIERYQTIEEVLIDLKAAKQDLNLPDRSEQTISTERETAKTQNLQQATADQMSQTTNETFSGSARSSKSIFAIGLVIVLFISAVGFFSYRYFAPNKEIDSIAVMPFVNESGNADVEYLSDGMTENLISSLSTIPNLSIKARSTVFTYKGKEILAKKIGAELNVDAVLLGHMVQRGDNLKLNLELVDTVSEDVLWSANYDREMKDLVSLQSEIARDVSDKLRLKLTTAEQKQVAKTYTPNAEAEQAYLKGRFHWNKRNVKDFEKAIGFFKQAVEIDPYYALAYSGLAQTYAIMPLYGNFRPKEYKPLAKQLAVKALELDKNLAEAHTTLGYILNTYDFDWEGAEREYKTAIRLNPNYATAHQWYAEHLAFKGLPDEALEEISAALELDPFSLVINRMKGNVLGFAKRHDEAIDQLKKTIELYPENSLLKLNLGEAFAAKGMHSEAVEQFLAAFELDGKNPREIQKFKDAYKNQGWKGFWMEYLENLLKLRKTLLETNNTAYFKSESLAYAYAATKNKDKAFEFLNKAYEERDPDLVTIKMSEVYDFLSDDPRYQELIKNIGLPE